MKRKFLVTLAIVLSCTCAGEVRAGWLFGGSKQINDSCGADSCRNNACDSHGSDSCWHSGCDECDDECDCDRECCECCGKKKPKKRKKCCLFTCISCSEPPRAEAAFSLPARIDQNLGRESARLDEESAKLKRESANLSGDRVDAVEKDLTRLTLVVEQLAKGQKQQQEDLTKATLILERIAQKVGP